MALYTVVTGNTALAADLNQVVNLLNGTDTTTQLTVSNRIRAQLAGATAAAGFVGGIASGTAPSTGTFAVGDVIVVQTGSMIVCTVAGSPGTWVSVGVPLDSTATDIQPLGTQAAGSIGKAADAGHVHPTTGVGLLGTAGTWTALQTFSSGASLGNSPTANSSADTTGNTWTNTAYRLAIGFGNQARQLFTASTRDDTKAVEGDILFNV